MTATDFHAQPDGSFNWTPALEQQISPPLRAGELAPEAPWVFEPLFTFDPPDPHGYPAYNAGARARLEAAGIVQAATAQALPSDPAIWREALQDLLVANGDTRINWRECVSLPIWLTRCMLLSIGLAPTLDILQRLTERTLHSIETREPPVLNHSARLLSGPANLALRGLLASDEASFNALRHHLTWIGQLSIGAPYALRAANTLSSFGDAWREAGDQVFSLPVLLRALKLFGGDCVPLCIFAVRLESSMTHAGLRKAALPKARRMLQTLLPLHDGRLLDLPLAFPQEGVMQQFLLQLIERWPLYSLHRLLVEIPKKPELGSLVVNALRAHPDWRVPLQAQLPPELYAVLATLIGTPAPDDSLAKPEKSPMHSASTPEHGIHAEPDGQFHWSEEDEQRYQAMTNSHGYPYGFTDGPDFRLGLARAGDAKAAHANFADMIGWWARGQLTLVRDYLPEARDLLYVATRLHHPAMFDVLLQAPGEDLLQRAWLDAFARWPLVALRHALAWRGDMVDAAIPFAGGRTQSKARSAKLALIDTLIAQALTAHPDWVPPLRDALAAAPVTEAELQRFDGIRAGLAGGGDTAPSEHLPELLREPPWRREKKPTAKEKAAQPWLKLPTKLPAPPLFLVPAQLPAPRLVESDLPLDADAIADLLVMLMLGKPGAPWPGLAQVLPAFTPVSLADFGRALFQAWEGAGAASEHKWMLFAQAMLGNSETLGLLVARTAGWPSRGLFYLAKYGLLTLGDMGTRSDAVGEAALRSLLRFAEKGKPSLRQPARVQLERVAAAIGMSADELADRLVPDLDLTSPEAFRFDLGERVHTLHFDENLLPFVRDADGKRLKDLPKPRADDGDCTDTVARWKAQKKVTKTLASEQIARMEQALVRGRSWTAADFTRLFRHHPLLRLLGQRLLWVAQGPDADAEAAGVLLRIAEDFTLLDADDVLVTLPIGARLSLAHPLDMDAATLARWSEVWADYELLPPFPQLGRPVFRLSDAEIAQPSTLARCTGWTLATGSLLGLLQKGWQRLSDGAHVYGLRLPLGENAAAELMLAESFDIAEPHATPTQVIERFGFTGETSARQRSEALYALEGCRT